MWRVEVTESPGTALRRWPEVVWRLDFFLWRILSDLIVSDFGSDHSILERLCECPIFSAGKASVTVSEFLYVWWAGVWGPIGAGKASVARVLPSAYCEVRSRYIELLFTVLGAAQDEVRGESIGLFYLDDDAGIGTGGQKVLHL